MSNKQDKNSTEIMLIEPNRFSGQIEQELIMRTTGIIDVALFPDPLAALNILSKNVKYSIIIAEINTPRLNGFDLIKNLERLDLLDIPVILMSSDETLKDKSLEIGAFGFLRKPFYADELKVMVEQAMSMIL